jgi:predicted nucleic acid-binding protein
MLVIDPSIAVKWVVEEPGTADAVLLLRKTKLIAPELLVAECANILWKKVRKHGLSTEEGLLAARILQGAEIELWPTRPLLEEATRLAINLDHPAYDCLYLALALERDCRFATADEHFLGKVNRTTRARLRDRIVGLRQAASIEL